MERGSLVNSSLERSDKCGAIEHIKRARQLEHFVGTGGVKQAENGLYALPGIDRVKRDPGITFFFYSWLHDVKVPTEKS